MNKKVKLKGRLNMYMRWPVLLSALLLVATVLMYLVDYRAGLLMTACFVLYVAAAIVIYFYLKPSIVDELVNFAIEFAQVQHNLIHDLEIPYAILDETGKLLWANSCMKEIMGEFIDMKNISTLIPDIKQEMLPDDEEEKKYAHIRYKERYYKAEIMKVCIDDFAMENKVVEMQPEAYQLFAFYLFDETEIQMSRKEIQNQKLICGIILVDNYEEAQNMDEAIIKKIMPHSIDSEKAVIGSMIMDADAIVAASEMLTGDDFYQRQFGILFETMVELYNEGKPVDVLTLQERLKMKDVPEEFASIEYISELVDSVPISTNIRQYAQTVADDAMLRRLIRVNEEIANACYQHKESVEEIMNTTEKRIFDVIQKKSTDEYVPIQDVVLSVIDKIEAAARHKGTVTGLATGFYDLDYKTSGLQPSDLILIAARPSMGKTAFVLNLAQYMCVRNHVPTAIFSLEMSKDQLVNRILSMESKVDSQSMRTGTLQPADWEKLIESAGVISTAPLIIDDTPGISITELRSKCRKYKLENDLGLVIIDYLQLMTGGSKKQESRQQEISEISRSLKALAREINAPVIALSQLSRACETRPDHRPMLSDLRESGAIEQDADVVMFLYRDDYYNKDTDKKNISEVIIAKQRNGPIGTVELVWLPNYTKFANKEK